MDERGCSRRSEQGTLDESEETASDGVCAETVAGKELIVTRAAVDTLGFAPEERAYHPHVTLARCPDPWRREAIDKFKTALTGPVARGDWETVARHIEALPEEERAGYQAMVELARALVGERVSWS